MSPSHHVPPHGTVPQIFSEQKNKKKWQAASQLNNRHDRQTLWSVYRHPHTCDFTVTAPKLCLRISNNLAYHYIRAQMLSQDWGWLPSSGFLRVLKLGQLRLFEVLAHSQGPRTNLDAHSSLQTRGANEDVNEE